MKPYDTQGHGAVVRNGHPYIKKTKSVENVPPWLYLKGILRGTSKKRPWEPS